MWLIMSRPKGFHHSLETRKKMSMSQKGRVITDEMRRNMSLAHIGKPSPKRNQIPLTCQFCGNPYTRPLNQVSKSKYCSKRCSATSRARKQEKYPVEIAALVKVYREMWRRCSNPKSTAYHNYGGRGIKVCEDWKDVNTFIADMLPSYSSGLSIDRIDNDGDYSPENCRWATYKQQANNRRQYTGIKSNTRYFTVHNQRMTMSQWADYLGVPKSRLSMRLYKYKWPVERVFS